jgi:RNA polymerase sigma factor (sigma-70 family)
MWSVRDLLEPGELEHLRLVAQWQKRPVQGVVIDEVRRQFGSSCRRGYTPKINRTKWLADVAPPVSDDEPVLDRLVREERIQQLVDAIDRLPPHQQVAIRWHLAGHNYRGISKLMGISPHTVEHHLRKAKSLLFYYLGAK